MKVCRVCLATGVKMYHMPEHKLSVVYELVTGVEVNTEDELPKMLCWECVARLSSAHNFIRKALKTHLILVDKTKSSRFISMGDIQSIDKTQLKSTLGTKFYRDNFSDLHIIKKSDNINEHFNNQEEQIFVTNIGVEKDPIKIEYLDETEEQKFEYEDNIKEDIYNERNDMKFLSIDFKIEPHEGSDKEYVNEEMLIDNGCFVSDHLKEHKNIVDECNEVDLFKQGQRYNIKTPLSSAKSNDVLPNCKELKVVVADIMLGPTEPNTQDSFKYLTKAQSTKDNKKNIFHRPISKKKKETLKHNMKTVKVSKYIEIICDNSNIDYPESKSQIVKMWTDSINDNISATSSKNFLACDKPPQIETSHIKHKTSNSKNTKKTDFTCKYCSYETSFKSRLKYHMNTKHPKSSFNCAHCDFVTTIKASLIGHINAKHTKNIIFNCSYCSYKTHVKTNLRAHVNTKHTKNNIFNCSYCKYETTIKPNLITHINNKHTKIDIFKCSFCNYKVYNKLSLNRHVNAKHTKTNVFNCSYCSFKSYRRCHLNTHVNAKHTELLDESKHS